MAAAARQDALPGPPSRAPVPATWSSQPGRGASRNLRSRVPARGHFRCRSSLASKENCQVSSGGERGEKRSEAVCPGALQAPRPQASGCPGGPGDRSRALTRRDPAPSPQPSTGQAQTVKQPRGSPHPHSHPHLGDDGGGLSEPRPRRLPTPLAQLCGPCAQPSPSQRARGAFGRRVWRGKKNGGHSNAADGRWGLRGPEKADLRGRKLDHPWALEPHRFGLWDDQPSPLDETSPSTENSGQRPKRARKVSEAPVDDGWNG
ncbi:translation initiation factor IF-2-like [Zalophus californianus]|uniref:Translation initiation factor IF-2-like n=1 Tax=Zalophus californianus TaxID=9704 RepID=A0A6J2FI86_ZALCA|nr:translation initiation factor IF-2-like [Zalophus californianus]